MKRMDGKTPVFAPGTPVEWIGVVCEGNKIMAMVGPDLQQGPGGFGDTIPEALRGLADQMEKEKWTSQSELRQPPHHRLISRDEHQGGSRR
jgi:hypothetical protein